LVKRTTLKLGPNGHLLLLAMALHHGLGQVFGGLRLVTFQE
jgi:hypothetical protein